MAGIGRHLRAETELLNDFFLALSQVATDTPFGGRGLVRRVIRRAARRFVGDNWAGGGEATSALEICEEHIRRLVAVGLQEEGSHTFNTTPDGIEVKVASQYCLYRKYCLEYRDEPAFVCPRLASLEVVLEKRLEAPYDVRVEPDLMAGYCRGIIIPRERKVGTVGVSRGPDRLMLAGTPLLLFSLKLFSSILKSIIRYAPPQIVVPILYEAGLQSAQTGASNLRQYYSRLEEYLPLAFSDMREMGWGRLKLISVAEEEGRVEVTCDNSFEVFAHSEYGFVYRGSRVICHTIRGVLAGMVEAFWEREMICQEMECQAVGDEVCRFVVVPRNVKDGEDLESLE